MSNENTFEPENIPSLNDLDFFADAKKAYETRGMILKVLESLPQEKYRRLEIAAIRALPSYPALLRDVVGLMVASGKLDVGKILEGGNGDE